MSIITGAILPVFAGLGLDDGLVLCILTHTLFHLYPHRILLKDRKAENSGSEIQIHEHY